MQSACFQYLFSCVLFILLCAKPSPAQQQETNPVKELISYTNSIYGADDRLINGTYYVPTHPLALGHPYFLTDDWLPANLYIKGIEFENVNIKYNIEDERIILRRQYEKGLVEPIVLNNSFIDSLTIGDHHFLNSILFDEGDNTTFLELVCRGKITSFLKHTNSYKDELSPQVMYGKYKEPKSTLFIYADSSLRLINRKKEFLELYLNNEKRIKKFMKTNNIGFKRAEKDQLIKLFEYCDGL